MDKRLIVTIPHYNNFEGLLTSIRSIREQFEIDIVITDDGSNSKLNEKLIISSYKNQGKIFFQYLDKNYGVGIAANKCLQFVKKGKLRKLLYSKEDLLLDGCHSEKSILNHTKFLKSINKPKYAIWSLMKNRNPEKVTKYLKCFKKLVAIKIPGEPNSCSPQLLKKIANKNGIECLTASNIQSAIKLLSSGKPKSISMIGSLYTCGFALNLNDR